MADNPDPQALARHLVTLTSPAKASGLPRFRWTPGMLDPRDGARVLAVLDHGRTLWHLPGGERGRIEVETEMEGLSADREWFPDLTDPATLGCLLALVREAWGFPETFAHRTPRVPWGVRCPGLSGYMAYGPTEAHALAAALEAAP